MNEQLKTPIEWVNELYTGKVRERLIEYSEKHKSFRRKYKCEKRCHLDNLFTWSKTVEGSYFWLKVYENNNTLPQSWIDEVEGKTESNKSTFDLIRSWANDRNLLQKDNSFKQLAKLMEESGELADALLKSKPDEFKDAIGDCVVVLTILAAQNGLNIEDCIEAAYQEIKDRKGKNVGGNFIKE